VAWVAWLTGIPGSGKSSVARQAAAHLAGAGARVRVLDLDEIRRVVTPVPRYTVEEREIVYRALVYMALLLVQEGISVLVDATAHRRRYRDLARALIPAFAEIYVQASLDRCRARARDRREGFAPPDVYAHAGGERSTVPGVDEPYEPPLRPDLILDTDRLSVSEASERLVRFLEGPMADRSAAAEGSGAGT
jgi:adenylylsulfate kinase